VKVTFWGVRGSIPTVTKQTQVYGGSTPCVTVESSDTILILDAGSGIRHLGESGVLDKYETINILLTHLHMDHIQGLGFFTPFFQKGRNIRLWGPSGSSTLVKRLNRYLSPPLFPVRIRDFMCDMTLSDMPMKGLDVDPFRIKGAYICHPGPTLGFRVSDGKHTMTYIPDHEPALASRYFPQSAQWTSGFDLVDGTDLMIHDAQFTDEEYAQCIGWGHSTVGHALALAQMAGTKKFVMFHHDPSHSDEYLDKMYEEYGCGSQDFPVLIGREGESIEI
jgi:phosphoribosyl 1,2-cyclic phosphodiesterase